MFLWVWDVILVPEPLESCGRLLGKNPTKSRPKPRQGVRVMTKKPKAATLRRLIIVPGGLITSPWVVLVVLVLVFVVPGVVLVVVDVVASHYVY